MMLSQRCNKSCTRGKTSSRTVLSPLLSSAPRCSRNRPWLTIPRGLAPATRAPVEETVQTLPGHQKTDLLSIHRIATAEGATFRARRGLPLPEPKLAARGSRTLGLTRRVLPLQPSTYRRRTGRATLSSSCGAGSPREAVLLRRHRWGPLVASPPHSRIPRTGRVSQSTPSRK